MSLHSLRTIPLAAAIAASLALSSAAMLPALAATTAAVSMTEPQENHYAFTPGPLTVPAGTALTWTNKTDASHTVTADGGAFSSQALSQNQTFSFTFSSPGTFAYHCTIHPYMKGVITVSAANVSAAAPVQAPSTLPKTGEGGGHGSELPLWAGAWLLAGLVVVTPLAGLLARRRGR